jgi:hypothetical protein
VEHPEPDAVPTALTAKNESCLNVASLGCLISKNEASLGPLPGPPLAGLVRAHITLAMLALAYLAATRAREHRNDHESAVGRSAEQLIPLSSTRSIDYSPRSSSPRSPVSIRSFAGHTHVDDGNTQTRACHHRRRGQRRPT